jgi:hypothetical protein
MIQFDSMRRNDGHASDARALPTRLTPRFVSHCTHLDVFHVLDLARPDLHALEDRPEGLER